MSLSILSFKPGHDGSIAHLSDGKLKFSIEAEKDSFPRYYSLTPDLLLSAMSKIDCIPDVVSVSGWVKGFHSIEAPLQAGYYGIDKSRQIVAETSVFGKRVRLFSSTHERSHLLCGYGLSPYPQGEPCYALVWEGNIGNFYEIDERVEVHHLGRVLEDPGNKYSFLFSVGDPDFPPVKSHFRFEDAGKLMALAAFSDRTVPTNDEQTIIDFILSRQSILLSTSKEALSRFQVYNSGVASTAFKSLAGKLSDAIFNKFHSFACAHMTKRLPLIITGGCGLNCEWNTKWANCGLFTDVFIPPCTNDTGSAIGTALDAQLYFEGRAKVNWSVYAGSVFVMDAPISSAFRKRPFSYCAVAEFLSEGKVLAWVQGRYEMGPRALGNRSILATPLNRTMRDRLNRIKEREDYRPIAPVCLEEELSRISDSCRPSPYMLYFNRVTTDALPAITHVDGSARFQTVNQRENEPLFDLLTAVREKTGFGVLCNTSLNFKGKGFINRSSDLMQYCCQTGIDGFVIGDQFYVRADLG